ncbi:MAG TPA: GMC family oxidoreductase N-terminal domain-containing protein [Kribbella sp.]
MNVEQDPYDYVVVGGGVAGCVIAARLSENSDVRVLLLEAGPHERLAEMAIPTAWPSFIGSAADWGETIFEPETGREIPWPRGYGLGGSANINGMVFLRGHRSDYDTWPKVGAKGWGYEDLLPFFKRCERTEGRDPAVRGTSGPLAVGPSNAKLSPALSPVVGAMLDAARETGHPSSLDPTAGLDEGFGWHDLAIKGGQRRSAVDSYLVPALRRPNLTVIAEAVVHRVLIEGERCVGVEYARGGQLVRLRCAREVVLTSGAVGSAQLLLQSGIGPAAHLRQVGVNVVLDLPGVGNNLQDHTLSTLVYRPTRDVPHCANGTGEASGLLRSDSARERANLQILMIGFPFHVRTLSGPDNGYTMATSLMSPDSRGSVRLSSSTPGQTPVLKPEYFSDARDMQAMVAGLRLAREIGSAGALASWRAEEVLPGPGVTSDAELRAYVRDSFISYFHPAGTCRIGVDEMAVVDAELRVRGLSGLRVADASVMPVIVSANTMAAVYGIAERAASLIGD